MIKILIADDHPVVREGLKQILAACADMHVGGEASDGDEVLHKVRQQEWSLDLLHGIPVHRGHDLLHESNL